MLYDNAQLLELLALAWRKTGDDLFRRRAQETVAWLKREMIVDGGGFASSLDADSEGEEGKFYVWSPEEIVAVLGAEDAARFNQAYDVTPEGNFEGHNILNRLKSGSATADEENYLVPLRAKLLEARAKRVRPGLDDKVLADWNGLMIAALANAGAILNESTWIDLAKSAFRFVSESMTRDDRLGHSWRAGGLLFPGLSSDYGSMIRAALALHRATGEGAYLDRAVRWQALLEAHHADAEDGGYFLTADDGGELILRPNSTRDDAIPNPHAWTAQNLIRLSSAHRNNIPIGKDRSPVRKAAAARGSQSLRPRVALIRTGYAAASRRNRRDREPGQRSLRPRQPHNHSSQARSCARRTSPRFPRNIRPGQKSKRQRRGGSLRLPRRNLLAADQRSRKTRRRARGLSHSLLHCGLRALAPFPSVRM